MRSPPISFRPSRAEAYQCGNLDLPPKRCPCPDRHTVGHLGRPPDASPVPLGRRWCGASAGVLIPQARQPKNSDLLTTVFTCRASGENSRNRTDASPSDWEARISGAPSKTKYARFKLGSNVASLAANSLNALGRTTSESPLRPESDRQRLRRNMP
jgi:hypothetical protein